MELATDFYTENVYELREQLEATLFVKDKTGPIKKLDNTFYIGHPNKSIKTIALYVKRDMGPVRLRLEVRLKQQAIKKHGLQFPVTRVELNFGEFFSFKVFMADKVLKRELGLVSKQPAQNDLEKKLCLASARSWFSSFLQRVDGRKFPLMEKLELLKKAEYPRNPALYVAEVINGQAAIDLINIFWRSWKF